MIDPALIHAATGLLRCKRFGLSLALLVMTIFLPGCAPRIEVLPSPAPTPLPVVTVAPETHALAVRGVDFDPSLELLQVSANGGVTLLVAIQNRGLSTETNVRVAARLMDPSDRYRELVGEVVTLPVLTPGAVRVARFTQVSALPRRTTYRLLIQVEPAAGEADTADNAAGFDIVVHGQD